MIDGPAALAVAATVVGAIGLGLFARHRRRTRGRRALARELDERLEAALAPGTGSHLEAAPTVRRLAVVDADPDDDAPDEAAAASVPVVRVALETTDAPGTKIVLEYVAAVLEAVHPVFVERDERVHCYDVEFTFGPDGLFVEGECRRVSVAPSLATELLENDRYGAFELSRDVKREDRNDGPTTLWTDCRSVSRLSGDRRSTDSRPE